nr:DUF3991 domain-containing protein [Bradyrhizobium sp. 142]
MREVRHGTTWAAHLDSDAVVTDWEERGPEWRGFASSAARCCFASDGRRHSRAERAAGCTAGCRDGQQSAGRGLCRGAGGHRARSRLRLRAAAACRRALERTAASGQQDEEGRGGKGKPGCRMPAGRVKGEASPAFRGP